MEFIREIPWPAAERQVIKAATEGLPSEEDDLLEMFVQLARSAGKAGTAALYLPSLGGQWVCEVAQPPSLIGSPFDAPGEVLRSLRQADTYEDDWALWAPLFVDGTLEGCLLVTRSPEQDKFAASDALGAGTYAGLGALLLELSGAREAQSRTTLLEERERISRDLHDLAIQDLFAVGIMLRTLLTDTSEGLPRMATGRRLEEALEKLETSIGQIRGIVHDLKTGDSAATFVEALEAEASRSRTHLGFAPTLTLAVDGRASAELDDQQAVEASDRISPRLADDAIAVLREALTNVAKHAGARSVQVRVDVHGRGPSGELEMLIVDDGAGVDPSVTRSSGLSNMAGRAATHGGTFAVSAGPRGRGTSLVWRAPLN